MEGSEGKRDLCQEETPVHSRQSNVRTKVCEAYLEDNRSLPWLRQVPVKGERAEGRLGTRGPWGGGGSITASRRGRSSNVPPQLGRVGVAVTLVETAGKGGAASWCSLAMP